MWPKGVGQGAWRAFQWLPSSRDMARSAHGHAFFKCTAGILDSSEEQDKKPVGRARGWQKSSSMRSNLGLLSQWHVNDGYSFHPVIGKATLRLHSP